jgi:hypothetical protein
VAPSNEETALHAELWHASLGTCRPGLDSAGEAAGPRGWFECSGAIHRNAIMTGGVSSWVSWGARQATDANLSLGPVKIHRNHSPPLTDGEHDDEMAEPT